MLATLGPAVARAASLVLLVGLAPGAAIPVQSAERLQCTRDRRAMESSHEQHNNDLIRWRARWSGDNCRVDLIATGELRFNSEFTDIVSITNDGSLDLYDVDGGTTRRLTMRSDRAGRLNRTYFVDDREQPWDDAARRWLASLLIDLDRMSGIGIDYRFPMLVSAGGARAVLDETEKITSDYARSLYLRRLVDTQRLNDGEYQRVVDIAARDMRSDYEMSRVLRDVADHASLDSETMRTAYIAAVGRMSSDYERSRVLQTVFAKSSVSRETARAAVRAAGTFNSDYERSRVLLAAIDSKALTGDDVITVLETITRSHSDYEKSRVLLAVAAKWTLTADSRKAYLHAADTIRSDYENRRVLSALVKQETR